jgi:hypothetical protein
MECSSQKLAISRVENSAAPPPAQRRRHEVGVEDEMARAVAYHPRHRQRGEVAGGLGIHQQAKVLAAHAHGALVGPGIFVVQNPRFGHEARIRAAGLQRAVVTVGLARRDGEQGYNAVARGRKQIRHGARLGKWIAFRHVEGQAIGKDAARVQQRNSAVVKRLPIELHAAESIGSEPQRRHGKLNGIFEVAALDLEVVRPQVHALGPDYSRKQLHIPVRILYHTIPYTELDFIHGCPPFPRRGTMMRRGVAWSSIGSTS